jgi:hypothetical protein
MTTESRISGRGKMAVAREWLYKHVSAVTDSHDRSNRHEYNNTRTLGDDVLCWVCIQNLEKEHVPSIGQGEARHIKYNTLKLGCGQRKYKRLKLGGGQAYDRSSD